jgi:DNA-binding NarL/FixJ family response regulator
MPATAGNGELVRILLADMTTMLASIVSAAVGHAPDLDVAGRSAPGADLADQIRQTRADVVVLQSARAERSRDVSTLLERFPKLKILAITDDCHAGFLHELRPYVTRLGDISAQSLADALRGRAAPTLN